MKVAPCPGLLLTSISPPWERQMARAMARPRPVPPDARPRAPSAPVEPLEQVREMLGGDPLAIVTHRDSRRAIGA